MAKRHHRKLKAADKTQIHWVGKLKTEFLEPTYNNLQTIQLLICDFIYWQDDFHYHLVSLIILEDIFHVAAHFVEF